MKGWHWGILAVIFIAYLVGVKAPGIGQKVFSAVGM
jgi:hypothetical protein